MAALSKIPSRTGVVMLVGILATCGILLARFSRLETETGVRV
jgi:hypothetical protein